MLQFLSRQNDEFEAGSVKHTYENWTLITSDKEVFEAITGMPINIKCDLSQSHVMSLPLRKTESGEFISPIFVVQ